MTWAQDNPFAVTDVEVDPPRVVIRYETRELAEWYIDYLWDYGGSMNRAKIDRGGYDIAVTAAKNSPKKMSARVATARRMDYSRGIAKPPIITTRRKAKAMPPRGRRAAQEEPEATAEENGAASFDHHLTKDLSPTMMDYADWFHENVTDIDALGKSDPGRLLALGSTLYPHFQKSDINQTRRAARKAEREAAAAPAEEPPAPARKGRGAPAAAKSAAAPAAPARGRRGRPAAAAPAEAPY